MASEGAAEWIPHVESILEEEDLDESEQQAAESLLQYLQQTTAENPPDLKRVGRMLGKIDKNKRARHHLGWDI